MFWKKKSPEEERLKQLIPLLKESDIDKRFSAISSLAKLEFSSRLLALLENKNVRIRTSAAFALSHMISKFPGLRKQLVEQIIELLVHKDLLMQFYAVGTLGHIAANFPEVLKDSMPTIISLWKESTSEQVGPAMAVSEIGKSAPQLFGNLLPSLTEIALRKRDFSVSSIILKHPQLLNDFAYHLMEFIKKVDKASEVDVIGAAKMLIRLSKSSPELEQLVWNYAERLIKENNVQARVFASYLIGEIGLNNPEVAINILLPQLDKSEWGHMYHTILAVGRISSKSSVLAEKVKPKLMELKKKPWPIFRGFVGVSLIYASLASPEFVEKVSVKISDFYGDKHAIAGKGLAVSLKILSNLPFGIVSDALSNLADSVWENSFMQNDKTRYGVSAALSEITYNYEHDIDGYIISLIVELLKDKREDIRFNAVCAILWIAGICPEDVKELIPKIVELLEDKSPNVRILAAATLYEFIPYYSELIKELAFYRLIKCLEDKSQPNAHVNAMKLLSRLGSARMEE